MSGLLSDGAAFAVMDVLGGFCRLERREGTLDGAVPVRVARACVPLLEGNAYGFQVVATRELRVRRELGGLRVVLPDDLLRMARATPSRLAACGLLSGEWLRVLDHGLEVGRGFDRLQLFTGLLVRPRPGVWLRLTAAANRRNLLVEVDEAVLPDDGGWVPLVLNLRLPLRGVDRVRLSGELACLAPVQPGVRIARRTLSEAPEVGRRHLDFYDEAYFATKRGDVTRKYRRLVSRLPEVRHAPDDDDGSAQVVTAGPVDCEVEALGPFTTAAGPRPQPRWAQALETVVFRNAVSFEVIFDGHTLAIDADRQRLETAGRELERVWRAALGEEAIEARRGALLYLVKYFTPHPPGEPHFFVKPWALTCTAPGWSCLLDGVHGDGFDVLRGVVATDAFHATPAVFHVRHIGAPIRMAQGDALLRLVPIPRELLRAGFETVALPDGI